MQALNAEHDMRYAIILSGHTMALGVVRALGERGIPIVLVHYDERDMAHVSKYVSEVIAAPHPEHFERQFIELLVRQATRFPDAVIFPVSDETVVAVARHKALLESYFRVACPDWTICQKYIEKIYTYELADKLGIPAPKTLIPTSEADVFKYAEQIDFPCLIKPSQSHLFYAHFGKKMFPVDNPEDLIATYRSASRAGLQVMLQEIIPGGDDNVVNYNAYFSEGKPLYEFTAQHIRNAPPWWGSPRVVLSTEIPEIIQYGRRLLQGMGFFGYACTEFKKDSRDGTYKLMEVNGRHNLSTLLAVRCGLNFPWLQYHHLTGGILPTGTDYTKNIYWIDLVRDLGYSIKYFRQEGYATRAYLRPYLQRHVFAIFSLRDLRPFIKRCTFLLKTGCLYLFHHIGQFRSDTTQKQLPL